jgi:hypothetical protein
MIRDAAGVTALRAGQPTPRNPAAEAGATPASPAAPVPNPSLRIEPALNLVVLEFRDGTGEVARTIPSPREIDAYRLGQPAEGTEAGELDLTR